MYNDTDEELVGYAPVPFEPWVRKRALLLKQHLNELGVQRADVELGYSMDEAILLLAGELLLPEMPFLVTIPIADDELVLVHYDTSMGPKPAKSMSRLIRNLGVARPDGILSVRTDLPWILTTFKGASIAAGMGYITVPISDLKRVVGPPPH
jgi:hypothetical protein